MHFVFYKQKGGIALRKKRNNHIYNKFKTIKL